MQRNARHIAALREHGWLLGLLAIYTAGVAVMTVAYWRFPGNLVAIKSGFYFSGLILVVVFFMAVVRAALSDRRRPFRAILRWGSAWAAAHGPSALVSCTTLPALMAVFLTGKNLIPSIQPFSWDVSLAELDRALHGGMPWELLQPVLGHPAITRIISYIYTFWFMLLFGAWIVWSLSSHPQRMRFLLSFALCWILLGTLAATALSSAGPVFYAEVTGDREMFADLMRYLEAVGSQSPLPSLDIRDRLWLSYLGDANQIASGISAMPSLHVAIVTLCAISGWYVSRLVGTLMTLFAILIFAGSIHLGWHYAVDGYASVLATIAIWIGVGRLLRQQDDLLPDEVPEQALPSLVELSRLQ